jgi:hypothetical protein
MIYHTYTNIDAEVKRGHGSFRSFSRRPQSTVRYWKATFYILSIIVGGILVTLPNTINASSTAATNVSSSSSSPSLSPSWFWKKEWNIWSLFRSKVIKDDAAATHKSSTTTDESVNQTDTNTESNNNKDEEESQSVLAQVFSNKQRSSTMDDWGNHDYDYPVDDDDDDDDDERNSNKDTSIWNTSPIMTLKRTQFLDRIAILASSIMRKDMSLLDMDRAKGTNDNNNKNHKYKDIDLDGTTPQSDLTLPGRHIHIVTTAALPWFTGTAVNPLLRAAYLHRKTQQINQQGPIGSSNMSASNDQQSPLSTTTASTRRWVTLVIPWLELPEDQIMLYNGRVFYNCSEQEQYIRNWLHQEANMSDVACTETGLEILFYPGRYHPGLGSIFAMGDIIDTIVNSTIISTKSNNETSTTNNETTTHGINNVDGSGSALIPRPLDVCILEEPEHCNWYRAPGDGWTKRFSYVVGVVHTSKCIVRVLYVFFFFFKNFRNLPYYQLFLIIHC